MKNRTMMIWGIIIVIVIIICVILLNIIKKYTNTDYYDNTEFEQQIIYDKTEEIQLLNNKNKYFVVESILSSIVNCIEEINGDTEYDTSIIEEDEAMQAFLEEGINIMNNMLDSQYKEKMNTTDESIIKIANRYSDYDCIINKIYVCDIDINIDIFIVDAYLGEKELNVIIKTDSETNTFSIFLEDFIEKYNYDKNMKIEDINIENTSIEQNEYNQFKYKNATDKLMAQHYLKNYINMLKYQTEMAYELLEQEYKNAKFSTYNDFEKFVNTKEISSTAMKEYEIINNEDHNLYICKDEYGYIYIFKVNDLMNYTVQLDDYTIQYEELIEKYKNMSDLDKCANNVNKFFEMVNMKDYNSIYNMLDSDFKSANFSTLESFENYAKETFFDYNVLGSMTIAEQGKNYVITVNYKNGYSSVAEKKVINIVMRLKEETDFVFSFSIGDVS
jgi:hypothetical protein